jgi:PPK2 family polyphosphate:nucleotide phosphotransferase
MAYRVHCAARAHGPHRDMDGGPSQVGYATRVEGDGSFQLGKIDPSEDGGLEESEAERRLAELTAELRELQELMFAAETNGILVILQGMDASGKDVTIGNVFAVADPASCRVAAFKEPTPEEEAHHFLWRADQFAPGRGELVIFDRSYYEQVILPQVHDELPEDDIRRRFANINDFERLLHEHGIILVKVFLHVSEEEQGRRLEEREANLETAWKISPRDWQERQFWDGYMTAYETTIDACASPHAPWYVTPADHQWFHNLAVAEALVEHLRPYRKDWIEARNRRGKEQQAEAERARNSAEQGEEDDD